MENFLHLAYILFRPKVQQPTQYTLKEKKKERPHTITVRNVLYGCTGDQLTELKLWITAAVDSTNPRDAEVRMGQNHFLAKYPLSQKMNKDRNLMMETFQVELHFSALFLQQT